MHSLSLVDTITNPPYAVGSPDLDQPKPPYVARQIKMDSPVRKPVPNSFYSLFGAAQVVGHCDVAVQTSYLTHTCPQFFGLGSIVLVIVWNSKYLGGFDWSNPGTRFNYHPLFMILGKSPITF